MIRISKLIQGLFTPPKLFANTQAMTNSFKTELMQGLHALGTCSETRTISTKDALKMALYLASATINKSTTAYSATGELAATGNYSAGGNAITNATEPALSTDTACWTPSASVSWANLTSSGSFDCALVYNNQFSTKRAISVHTFGAQSITAGTFTLTMPANDASNALVRIA
jgi:hypothetical protein